MQFYAGPIEVTVEILGSLLDVYIEADPVEITVSIEGTFVLGVAIDAGPINLYTSVVAMPTATGAPPVEGAPPPSTSAGFTTSVPMGNWVQWSKIGYLDFTIDESNVAGKAPLDWWGGVVDIKKLGNTQVVVYGYNGITFMKPHERAWEFKTIHRIGTVCKVVGTDDEHFFLDKTNRLHRLTVEGIQLIGYQEFLSQLTNPRLVYDLQDGMVYICDGTLGFVYNSRFPSFGQGPAELSDMVFTNAAQYAVATVIPMEIPKFYIVTDVYDFGTRKPKTIEYVEVATDVELNLVMKIDFKASEKDDFKSTRWFLVNPNGIAYCPCFGIDFRFHIKSDIEQTLKLDYLRVCGTVHGTSYLDARR